MAKSLSLVKGAGKMRGAIYYDGFNLYHAVDDLGKPHLKWCNLRLLGELVARGHARSIERAVFCTAYFPGDQGKRARHQAFVNAQALADVETMLGHATKEPMYRYSCKHRWDQPREKEGDINVAIAMIEDAYADLYDVAFLVTADTDQAATLRFIRRKFPEKKLVVVSPPGRDPSKHLRDLSAATIKLTESHLEQCLFPALVTRDGERSIVRPPEYDPPADWVPFAERPVVKPPKAPKAWGRAFRAEK